MKKDLVIFGSGGFAAGDLTWLIEDIIQDNNEWNLIGFLDDNINEIGKIKKTYEVLGDSSWLDEHRGTYCVIGIGVGTIREKIAEKLSSKVAGFPTMIHPSVQRSSHSTVGVGSLIMPGALVSGGVSVGAHVILNLGCKVGHDVQLRDFSTVAPGVNLSGWVEIGRYSDIGTGASIRQLIKIGENVQIGAGAVVVKDIPSNCTAVGVPAKVIK